MNKLVVVGVVVGAVGAALAIIITVLKGLEQDNIPTSWGDDDWDDLARRGDMGYYDPPPPPVE